MDKHMRRGVWPHIKKYLLAGILVTAPAFISLYVTVWLIEWVDSGVKSFLPEHLHSRMKFFGIPGTGILALLALLILIGFVSANWFGRFFVGMADRFLSHTPIFSSLYSTLKQLFHTFLGENTNSFRQVVFVEFPCKGCWSIGFVTGTCDEAEDSLGEKMLYVFIPTTPNPTNGFLIFMAKADLRIANMTVEQGLKAVVSMGITK